MEVIVRLQDRTLCASITSITGTYAEPEGRVIFAHWHNAAERVVDRGPGKEFAAPAHARSADLHLSSVCPGRHEAP
jgi:hypothetical protein